MMPQEPIRDIMERTIANLEFIEAHARLDGPFSTTQLLNSFLGALAHPWEAFRSHQSLKMTLAVAVTKGWPEVRKERPDDRDPTNLGDLIRMMRNGLAHGNINFYPATDGTIGAIQIWNCPPRSTRDWGAVLTVREMRAFLFRFRDLACVLCDEGVPMAQDLAS